MVKRQKEKQYQSAREYRTNQQLRRSKSATTAITATNATTQPTVQQQQQLIPFTHCALSLVPYEEPICNIRTGIVFDFHAVMKFILQYKRDPVTGRSCTSIIPASSSVLPQNNNDEMDVGYVRLRMDQNEEGQWQCPILTKPFNDRSKVVAIIQRQTQEEQESTDITAASRNHLLDANVYSYEAYLELNVKTNNYDDLVSGQPFHPTTDVILIFDPKNIPFNQRRDTIHAVSLQPQPSTDDGIESRNHSTTTTTNHNNNNINNDIRHSVTATRVMETVRKHQIQEEEKKKNEDNKKKRMKQQQQTMDLTVSNSVNIGNTIYYSSRDGEPLTVLASDVTTGRGGNAPPQGGTSSSSSSSSFTSTAISVSDTITNHPTVQKATNDDIIRAQCHVMRTILKKKGYVKLHATTKRNNTNDDSNNNTGDSAVLMIELHCDIAPRTCINFLSLCRQERYTDTIFHRLLPKFMIQGGKPVTTTTTNDTEKRKNSEGCSIWGTPFEDEFDHRLRHNSVGVVSMANSGPNTNQQQFFITFQACPHLDNVHSIFGTVISNSSNDNNTENDGIEVLNEWEQIPTNKKDKPIQEICILRTEILVDPAMEAYEYERKRIESLIRSRQIPTTPNETTTKQNNDTTIASQHGSPPQVGQYLSRQQKQQQSRSKIIDKTKNDLYDHNKSKNMYNERTIPTSATKPNATTTTTTTMTNTGTKFGNFSGW